MKVGSKRYQSGDPQENLENYVVLDESIILIAALLLEKEHNGLSLHRRPGG